MKRSSDTVRKHSADGSALRVRDAVRAAQLVTVTPTTSILDALRLITEAHASLLLVVGGGRLCGVIAYSDFSDRMRHGDVHAPVAEIMSKTPVTVSDEAFSDQRS